MRSGGGSYLSAGKQSVYSTATADKAKNCLIDGILCMGQIELNSVLKLNGLK